MGTGGLLGRRTGPDRWFWNGTGARSKARAEAGPAPGASRAGQAWLGGAAQPAQWIACGGSGRGARGPVAAGSRAARCRGRGRPRGSRRARSGVSTTTGTPATDGWASSSANGADADRARADRRVPVALGAAVVQRVVGVHQPQPARAHGGHQGVERRRHPARRGEVVPGGPGVAGVEADAEQRVVVQRGEVRAEVLDGRGQRPCRRPRSARRAAGARRRAGRRAPAAAARAADAARPRSGPRRRRSRRARPRPRSRAAAPRPGCARWWRSTARRSPRWGSRR